MANHKIENVEGIGPVIGKTAQCPREGHGALLENCRTPKNCEDLAQRAELSEAQILKFANMVDRYCLNGVSSELCRVAGGDGCRYGACAGAT